jgi:hypothetical protein
MDLVEIVCSAGLSAVLFIALEFTVILPLFKKIVTRSVSDTVNNDLVPKISTFVDTKVDDLTGQVTKSLFNKFRGFMGGSRKGVNSVLRRLADGEDPEDVLDTEQYEPSTIDKVVDILDTARQFLPDPSTRKAAKEQATNDGIMEH